MLHVHVEGGLSIYCAHYNTVLEITSRMYSIMWEPQQAVAGVLELYIIAGLEYETVIVHNDMYI